jgi:hypothetical protein
LAKTEPASAAEAINEAVTSKKAKQFLNFGDILPIIGNVKAPTIGSKIASNIMFLILFPHLPNFVDICREILQTKSPPDIYSFLKILRCVDPYQLLFFSID